MVGVTILMVKMYVFIFFFKQKTAYEIAGKGIASEESFRQALYTALDTFRNRKAYFEMRKNPLRKQYFDRSGDNEKLDLTSEPQND